MWQSGFPVELLLLPPLAIAAGIDLYLTLLFLGAVPTTTWWSEPLPGALGDLDSPGVMVIVGASYLLEFSAERFPTASVVWNAFHSVIRPVSGALLALLLLDGQPPLVIAAGAIAAGAIAWLTHSIRTGAAVLRWLRASPAPHPLLTSLVEDVIVLALVALVIDRPTWALGAALMLAVAGAWRGPSRARAFLFAARLAAGRVLQTLATRRWTPTADIPEWVRNALEARVSEPEARVSEPEARVSEPEARVSEPEARVSEPEVGRRGSPVGAHRLPGAPHFVTGWIVLGGDCPIFVFRGRRGSGSVDLGDLDARDVVESGLFRRVDLGRPRRASVFFALSGPSAESLRAEFIVA